MVKIKTDQLPGHLSVAMDILISFLESKQKCNDTFFENKQVGV